MTASNTNRIGLLLLIFLVALACNSCRTGPEPLYLIRGTVTDSVTGAPIDSAQVTVGDTISPVVVFHSNQHGEYAAYPDTFGVVHLYCRKEAYLTRMIDVELVGGKFVYKDVDFELVKK